MDCVAPPSKGGRRNPSVPSRCGSPLLLLTCSLLMTSSQSKATGHSKGFAFLDFNSVEDATKAKTDSQGQFVLEGKQIAVDFKKESLRSPNGAGGGGGAFGGSRKRGAGDGDSSGKRRKGGAGAGGAGSSSGGGSAFGGGFGAFGGSSGGGGNPGGGGKVRGRGGVGARMVAGNN